MFVLFTMVVMVYNGVYLNVFVNVVAGILIQHIFSQKVIMVSTVKV